MKTSKKFLFIIPVVLLGVFAFCFSSLAQENPEDVTSVRIDKPTIEKGYTVTHKDNDIRFAVTPNQVDQEVNVHLKNFEIDKSKLPEGKNIVSGTYEFDMLGREYNPIIVSKPSWLAVRYNSDNDAEKSIYHWDSNKDSWIKLPSYADKNSGYVKCITHLPYSKIVVLEEEKPKEEHTGAASWYYAGEKTAAMNIFNIGDKVKVINAANGKSCVVTIDGRGPFVHGRIIDLSNDSFSDIASLSEGVINVRVEKY